MKTLNKQDCCIVQGPPGTGKSYTIAFSCIIPSITGKLFVLRLWQNKGLVELIKQKPLGRFIPEGRISKTNLSIDERKQTGGVKNASPELHIPNGELLCATTMFCPAFSVKRKCHCVDCHNMT